MVERALERHVYRTKQGLSKQEISVHFNIRSFDLPYISVQCFANRANEFCDSATKTYIYSD